MPKSMEVMRRILPVLLSLFVLIAVTEGNVILCRTSPHSKAHNHFILHPTGTFKQRRAQRDEYSNLKYDGDYQNDKSPRKESFEDKILRAMLMRDSETSDYRAKEVLNDYSALEASLRADLLRDEAGRNEDEWTRRHMGSNRRIRYDNNQHENHDDDYN